MPQTELLRRPLPSFVRLRTVPDMQAVSRNLAEIHMEVFAIENARDKLRDSDRQVSRSGLTDIAVSGMAAVAKAEEAMEKLRKIRERLTDYRMQLENA